MSIAVTRPLSIADFLDWEARQDARFEFDGVQAIAMTGGTAAHATIQRNIAVALTIRLRGKPCSFYGSDLKIEVAGSVRYPDGFVVCAPVVPKDTIIRDPVVIFEVLSDSAGRTDTVTKNREYAATSSVRRYVILAQDEIGGTMFERVGTEWVGHLLEPETTLRLPEIDIAVPIIEFYEGLDLGTRLGADT